MTNEAVKEISKPKARRNWLMDYISQKGGVDILNLEAQDAYFLATNADPYLYMMRDLRTLFSEGKLLRSRVPSGMPYAGSCKHVMHYYLENSKMTVEPGDIEEQLKPGWIPEGWEKGAPVMFGKGTYDFSLMVVTPIEYNPEAVVEEVSKTQGYNFPNYRLPEFYAWLEWWNDE